MTIEQINIVRVAREILAYTCLKHGKFVQRGNVQINYCIDYAKTGELCTVLVPKLYEECDWIQECQRDLEECGRRCRILH